MADHGATLPQHGGTDSGGKPELDFSTNVNPAGPFPGLVAGLRGLDISRYPDPAYLALRHQLAKLHGVVAEQIVVGSGGAELIGRLVRCHQGGIHTWWPTFGEYAHAACLAGVPYSWGADWSGFVQGIPPEGMVLLCLPGNPDGFLPTDAQLAELAAVCTQRQCRLVLDLAYFPFLVSPPELPATAVRLYAPNKAMGAPGLRAGYLIDPQRAAELRSAVSSWILGCDGVLLLEAWCGDEFWHWLEKLRPEMHRCRELLGQGLRRLGWDVRESCATHLVARPNRGNSQAWAAALRERGIAVRDTTSMGLAGWLRLGARPREEIQSLLKLLSNLAAVEGRQVRKL